MDAASCVYGVLAGQAIAIAGMITALVICSTETTTRAEQNELEDELQKNLALIRLRGPQTKQDHIIMHLFLTGRLPGPKGPLFEPHRLNPDAVLLETAKIVIVTDVLLIAALYLL
jgi:hypothetical protein